jgi:hypothetical protein
MAQPTLTPNEIDAAGKRMVAAVETVLAELSEAGLSEADRAHFLASHAIYAANYDRAALTSIRQLADHYLAASVTGNETEDRSDRAHDVLDLAVLDLREIGFEGVAPYRMIAWNAFEGIRAESGAKDAIADLTRLREMIDKHLTELAAGVPQ